MERDQKVQTPYVFQYTDGYRSIITKISTLGITLTLLISICLAPIFANEYSDHTDQLILSSKYGKNKAIYAKIITGISFSILTYAIFIVLLYLPNLLIWGFDGWNAPIQLVYLTVTAPLSMLDLVLNLAFLLFATCLLTACISMFLSARLKSSFRVIAIISSFTFICMLQSPSTSNRFLDQLICTLPINVTSPFSIFNNYFYIIFGHCFTSYEFIPVIFGLLSVLFVYFGYKSFKKHQIS